FSPGGNQVAVANNQGIFIADLSGSNVRRVAALPGENSYLDWSPDGKLLRFTQRDASTGDGTLWEVTAEGRNLHALNSSAPGSTNEFGGRWTPDGSYYIYTSAHGEMNDLWALKEPSRAFPWL